MYFFNIRRNACAHYILQASRKTFSTSKNRKFMAHIKFYLIPLSGPNTRILIHLYMCKYIRANVNVHAHSPALYANINIIIILDLTTFAYEKGFAVSIFLIHMKCLIYKRGL